MSTARTRGPGSRIGGRGRLLARLRSLLAGARKFSEHRATSVAEHAWAAKFYDDLEATYIEGLAAPGARAGLDAVDRRRAVSRKTQLPHRVGPTESGRHL